MQTINTRANNSTNAPAMIPMTAPMGSTSDDSLVSGITVIVGVTTADDVTEMVGGGVVKSLEGVKTGTTITRKKF